MSNTPEDRMRRKLQQTTTDEGLRDFITQTDEPVRSEAAERLLKQRPRSSILVFLVDHVETVRERAWLQLLTHGPPNDDLRSLLERGAALIGSVIHAEAAARLLTQSPTDDDLLHVVRYGSSQQEEAWRRLRVRPPTVQQLRLVMVSAQSFRTEAANLLLAAAPPNNDLHNVLACVPALRVPVAERMMDQHPSIADLLCIIEHVDDVRPRAIQLLLGLGPSCDELKKVLYRHPGNRAVWQRFVDAPASNDDLHDVVRHCPALGTEAGRLLLARHPTEKQLESIIRHVADLRSFAEQQLSVLRRRSKGRRRK